MTQNLRLVSTRSELDLFERRAALLLRQLWPHRQFAEAISTFDKFDRAVKADIECTRGIVLLDDDRGLDFGGHDGSDDDETEDSFVKCLMVVGPSGTGKSGLLSSIRRRPENKKQLDGPDGDIRPVINMKVPEEPTPREVAKALFDAAGAPPPGRWTRGELARELRKLFEDLNTHQIQMDEAHVFAQDRTDRQITSLARFLKFLLVTVRVPIVLAGEESLEAVLLHKALKRRTFGVVRLEGYPWANLGDATEFMALAKQMLAYLGFEEEFISPREAMTLYYDSEGIIGLLAGAVVEAGRAAVSAGSRTLTTEHFANAWELRNPRATSVIADPFALVEDEFTHHPRNPYLADNDFFRHLWREKFSPETSADPEKQRVTRRRRRTKAPAEDRTFGS